MIRHPLDKQFPLRPGAVQLGGSFDEALRLICRGILKKIDMHALADYFRNTADPFATGEFWGKLMRASCLLCAYTDDPELRQIVDTAAADMLSIQRADGCISTVPDALQPQGSQGSDLWERKYALIGLLSYWELTGSSQALQACVRLVRYTNAQVGEPPRRPITETGWAFCGIESSSILEPILRVYHATGEPSARELADHILRRGCCSRQHIFEAVRNGVPPYRIGDNGNPHESIAKAYEMMSCFEGLCEYYRATGDKTHLDTVVTFWEALQEQEITLLGSGGADAPYNLGPGVGEQWNRTRIEQTNPAIDLMMETCVTVYWMKLCHQLLCLTGEVRYADALEVSLYNAILGALRPDGGFFEYFPRFNGTRNTKVNYSFNINGFDLSCCTANGPTGLALAPLAAFAGTPTGVALNLYIPATVHMPAEDGEILLALETEFPKLGYARLRVVSTPSGERVPLTLDLRVPGYAESFAVIPDGCPSRLQLGIPGQYLRVASEVAEGDSFLITMDYSPVRHTAPHGSDRAGDNFVAFTYGPILLARDSRDGVPPLTPVPCVEPTDWRVEDSARGGFLTLHLEVGGESLTLIDYASAGDWQGGSFAAWLPIRPSEE